MYTLINNRTETRKYRKRREKKREREREREREAKEDGVGEKWVAAEKRRMINERGCDVRDGGRGWLAEK